MGEYLCVLEREKKRGRESLAWSVAAEEEEKVFFFEKRKK
jgi:hypothetical protein